MKTLYYLNAVNLTFDYNKTLAEVKDSIFMKSNDFELKAGEAIINLNKKTAYFKGNVDIVLQNEAA